MNHVTPEDSSVAWHRTASSKARHMYMYTCTCIHVHVHAVASESGHLTWDRPANLKAGVYMYRILLSKRPWALAIDRPKNGGGRIHTDKYVYITYIYMNYRIIQKGGWALTRRWALTRENVSLGTYLKITAVLLW